MKSEQIQKDLQACYGEIAHEFSETRKKYSAEFEYCCHFIPSGVSVLDIGCGDGRFYGYLKEQKKNVDYTGLDFCEELLRIARHHYPEATFIHKHMERVDEVEAFDRIVCLASFHHLPGSALRRKTLHSISQALKPSGIFIVSVWNLWQLRYWKAWLRSWCTRDLFIPFGKQKIARYYHAFFPFELRNLLKKEGFMIEEEKMSSHNFIFVCRKKQLQVEPLPLLITDGYGA